MCGLSRARALKNIGRHLRHSNVSSHSCISVLGFRLLQQVTSVTFQLCTQVNGFSKPTQRQPTVDISCIARPLSHAEIGETPQSGLLPEGCMALESGCCCEQCLREPCLLAIFI